MEESNFGISLALKTLTSILAVTVAEVDLAKIDIDFDFDDELIEVSLSLVHLSQKLREVRG